MSKGVEVGKFKMCDDYVYGFKFFFRVYLKYREYFFDRNCFLKVF